MVSDIPSLILSGEYDPITPPAWAHQVKNSLRDSRYIILPNSGHGVSGSVGCGQSLVIDFFNLEDINMLDRSCTDDLPMIFSGTQNGDFNPPRAAYHLGTVAINQP